MVLLVIVGGFLAFLGILTLQYLMVVVMLVVIIAALLLLEFKKWVESLVEKIVSAARQPVPEVSALTGSVASLQEAVARIERRLDESGRREKE